MSEGMLGKLSVGDVSGLMRDLLEKLAGSEGPVFLVEFKKFITKQPCWVSPTPTRPAKLAKGKRGKKAIVRDWQRFYQKYFPELTIDLSNVVIPTREGFNRAIIVAKGLSLNRVLEVCAAHFPVSKSHEDMDAAVPTNERHPASGTYATICRDRVEADEELQNVSAQAHADAKRATLTLLERVLYELKYCDETENHLDLTKVTLCSGSRSSVGDVPIVDWRGGRLRVCANWYVVRDARPGLRSREAVS